MFRNITAALTAACLVGLGVIGLSTGASATYNHGGDECVPAAAYDETVVDKDAYVVHHDAVTHTETVVDKDAYDETVIDAAAVNKWYSWTGGQAESHPAPPAGSWQVDNGDHAGFPQNAGVYERPKGNSENSAWFYHVVIAEQSHVVHHAAETHEITVTDHDAYDETIPAQTHVVHHDAVTCPPGNPEDEIITGSLTESGVQNCDNLREDAVLTFDPTKATATATKDGVDIGAQDPRVYGDPDPGVYVITLTAKTGYTFAGGKTLVLPITIRAALTAENCGGTPPVEKKVLVCKYVGTPGVNEHLKEGKQPISVSVNTLKDFPGTFPWWFVDAQERSVAIGFDDGQEHSSTECPPATPNDKTATPTVNVVDECGTEDDEYSLAVTEGIIYTVVDGQVIATAKPGYVLDVDTNGYFVKDSSTKAHADIENFSTDDECPPGEQFSGVPFNAAPSTPSCTAGGSFATPVVQGGVVSSPAAGITQISFPNGDVYIDRRVAGQVTVEIFADVEITGLNEDLWELSGDHQYAVRTIALAPQLSGSACPLSTPPTTVPPTVVPPVTTTVHMVPATPVYHSTPTYYSSPSNLASTGSGDALALGIIAATIALLGTGLVVARRRYSRV